MKKPMINLRASLKINKRVNKRVNERVNNLTRVNFWQMQVMIIQNLKKQNKR